MLEDILVPLVAVGLAELGDKTRLSILLLSSRVRNHMHLLSGVMLAFLVVDGIAILAGEWITTVLPANLIKILAGSIFMIFGVLILKNNESGVENEYRFKSPFRSGFALIFFAEWGTRRRSLRVCSQRNTTV